MNVDAIRKYCLSFAEATENLQWGADLCFMVRKKIFAALSLDSVPQSLTLKCIPETFAELCEREDIIPAPYVGRYNWVMLQRLDALRDDELRDVIRQSYKMVAVKARPPAETKSKDPNRHKSPRKKHRLRP